ncbi:MAG TPA: hypothetical protein VGU61_19845 [Noviherbaspirillum sp.]|jgi:hypothetical protein|uniref:hypothetical protein n=1 Tax=Noviherbaspirillum sp. TaxID=1926288 RepID=UPI002DDD93AE|nr:hypothetical protein [Noviherbaspirillum sp.]HEV2612525.1 hypothetical protein [Noviherbaspirillum sp.]
MRRVRKEEVQIDRFVKPDALDYCLECWARVMQKDDRDLSASRMRLDDTGDPLLDERGNPIKVAYESDPYEEQRKQDMKYGEATGAVIQGMKPAHRWAIYRRCGISTLWKFPLLDFTVVLIEAEQDLRDKLKKNIATATLF